MINVSLLVGPGLLPCRRASARRPALATALATLVSATALAQPCTVQTEERLASATARFVAGPTTVAVTVPVGFRVEFLTFYLEVKDPQPDLFFQSGTQKIEVRD